MPLRELRLAALADAPAAFSTTHEEMAVQPMAFWADRAATNAAGDVSANFIAERRGRWVGMAGGYRLEPEQAHVELVAMWVAPEGRRAGVGRGLVAAVVSWAADIGCAEVQLWVPSGNEAATALYVECGFEPLDDYEASPADPCRDEQRMRFTLDR